MLNSNRFFIALLLLLTTSKNLAHVSFYAQANADNKKPILLLGDCHIAGDPIKTINKKGRLKKSAFFCKLLVDY